MNLYTKALKALGVAAAAATLISCTSTPNVEVDYNDSYNFSALKTYHILQDQKAEYPGQVGANLTNQRIASSIATALNNRNLTAIERDNADVLISFHLSTEEKLRPSPYGIHYRLGHHHRFGFGFGHDFDIYEYTEGELLIDMVDPKTNNVVWRGSSKETVRERSSNQARQQVITQQAIDIMNRLPRQ